MARIASKERFAMEQIEIPVSFHADKGYLLYCSKAGKMGLEQWREAYPVPAVLERVRVLNEIRI